MCRSYALADGVSRARELHGLAFRRATSNVPTSGMCAAEHTPPGPSRLLERRHGLAEIFERGGGVHVERHRIIYPHPERDLIILAENAPRHRQQFAQQCLDVFKAF